MEDTYFMFIFNEISMYVHYLVFSNVTTNWMVCRNKYFSQFQKDRDGRMLLGGGWRMKYILMKDFVEMANFLLVDRSGFNIRELVKSVMAVSYKNGSGDDSHERGPWCYLLSHLKYRTLNKWSCAFKFRSIICEDNCEIPDTWKCFGCL